MPEFFILLLTITNLCLIILAVIAIYAALDLRATLRRINAMLPDAEGALKDARHVLHRTRQLVQRGDLAAKQVEGVVRQACEALSGFLDRFAPLRMSMERLFFRRHHNGAGSGPRRHHRSSGSN